MHEMTGSRCVTSSFPVAWLSCACQRRPVSCVAAASQQHHHAHSHITHCLPTVLQRVQAHQVVDKSAAPPSFAEFASTADTDDPMDDPVFGACELPPAASSRHALTFVEWPHNVRVRCADEVFSRSVQQHLLSHASEGYFVPVAFTKPLFDDKVGPSLFLAAAA